MRCTNCGKEVPNTAKICGFCGHRLKVSAQPLQAALPPRPKPRSHIAGWVWALIGVAGAVAILLVLMLIVGGVIFLPRLQIPVLVELPTESICTDKAGFVNETIPDGTRVEPGTAFTKTWTIQNTGTCTWTTGYALVFKSGEQMGGNGVNYLPVDVAPGQSIGISLNLVAPNTAGTYRGDWIMRNASGVLFGHGDQANQPFWVQISVPTTAAGNTSTQNRCSLFSQSSMKVIWLDFAKNSDMIRLYFKMPGGVPGLEKAISGDNGSWDYHVEIGNYSSKYCGYLGYKERLYCDYPLTKGYANSVRSMQLYVNGCDHPIYSDQTAEIPAPVGGTSSGACSAGLGETACEAAGGNYVITFCMIPPCPEFCFCP